jgi:hypothetical protein
VVAGVIRTNVQKPKNETGIEVKDWGYFTERYNPRGVKGRISAYEKFVSDAVALAEDSGHAIAVVFRVPADIKESSARTGLAQAAKNLSVKIMVTGNVEDEGTLLVGVPVEETAAA